MTWLHRQRLDAVIAALHSVGAETVLDLGCGDGALLTRLARDPAIRRIVGLDISAEALQRLRATLAAAPAAIRDKVELVHGSMTQPDQGLRGFDAAVLVEAIEHIDPARLSVVERALFRDLAPRAVILTTPNSDFNGLLGVPGHRMRHRDHRFEWGRGKFRAWAGGVAQRAGYAVAFADIAGAHPEYGGASQMALFTAPTPAALAPTASRAARAPRF